MSYLAKNYNRKKISFKYGKGSFLYSTDGKKYLDFVQGIAVNSLGHAHPKLVKLLTNNQKNFGMFQMHFKFQKGKS
jgi:acetylornithine/N-succinyldiaminopimelate aminotransferase